MKEPLTAPVLDLRLDFDDLESAGVSEKTLESMTEKRMKDVANRVSDKLFAHFHDAISEACDYYALVEQNPNGKAIADIKEKSYVNILTEMKVDPENPYEVAIFLAARLIQEKHPFRGMIYRTSHTNSSVWSTPDQSCSVRVYPFEGRVEE
jgi:hypothetical protein